MMISIDVVTLIAVIASPFALLAVVIALFLWLRSEANSDRRYTHEIQREDRRDLLQISKNIELLVEAIQKEMKDFHGRLCSIEERSKGAK